MKDYLKSFITDYEVHDKKIIIYLENNKYLSIPYTKEDEINILKKIKEQLKNKDELNIKILSAKMGLFLIITTFIILIVSCLIAFGLNSLSLLVTCLGILSTFIEIREKNIYESRLNNLKMLNKKYLSKEKKKIKSNQNKKYLEDNLDMFLESKHKEKPLKLVKKITKL